MLAVLLIFQLIQSVLATLNLRTITGWHTRGAADLVPITSLITLRITARILVIAPARLTILILLTLANPGGFSGGITAGTIWLISGCRCHLLTLTILLLGWFAHGTGFTGRVGLPDLACYLLALLLLACSLLVLLIVRNAVTILFSHTNLLRDRTGLRNPILPSCLILITNCCHDCRISHAKNQGTRQNPQCDKSPNRHFPHLAHINPLSDSTRLPQTLLHAVYTGAS